MGLFFFCQKSTKILLKKQFLQNQAQPECIRPWILFNYCRKYIITVNGKAPNLSCDKISAKWYSEKFMIPFCHSASWSFAYLQKMLIANCQCAFQEIELCLWCLLILTGNSFLSLPFLCNYIWTWIYIII